MRSSSVLGAVLLIWAVVAQAGVVCDGVDDRFTTGINGDVFLTSTAGTAMLWIKPTGSATAGEPAANVGQIIIGNFNSVWGMSRANLASDDKLYAFSVTGGVEQNVGSTFSVDTWTHLAWVQTSGGVSLYKDGALVGTDTGATSIDSLGSGTVRICAGPGGTLVFNGQVANVKLFDTNLSAAQIEAEAKARMYSVNQAGNLTAYWKLTECGDGASCNAVAFFDASGNGRPATASVQGNGTGVTGAGSDRLSWPVGAN